jgi:hypothetical protein
MRELFINNVSSVDYTIYVNGVATNADGAVTAKAFLNESETGTTISVTSPSTGKYTAVLPMTMVSGEGNVRVEWSFTLQTSPMIVPEEYVVVTPYASWTTFVGKASYADFLDCERIARKVIDAYTGQTFGKISAIYTVEGIDTNSLKLPRRIMSVTEVEWQDQYTNPTVITAPVPSDGWNEYDWDVSADGWILRTPRSRSKLDMVYPTRFSFKRNISYNINGLWGYKSVPTNIQEAAKIIIANLLCKDQKYRDKYLESIKANDWDITFMKEAFQGTGSVTADQLLNEYRMYPGVGVI